MNSPAHKKHLLAPYKEMGAAFAITKDGYVRPCIYSHKEITTIDKLLESDIDSLFADYWELTPDKVCECQVCELRYVCQDCREIAGRSGGLDSKNPNCKY